MNSVYTKVISKMRRRRRNQPVVHFLIIFLQKIQKSKKKNLINSQLYEPKKMIKCGIVCKTGMSITATLKLWSLISLVQGGFSCTVSKKEWTFTFQFLDKCLNACDASFLTTTRWFITGLYILKRRERLWPYWHHGAGKGVEELS